MQVSNIIAPHTAYLSMFRTKIPLDDLLFLSSAKSPLYSRFRLVSGCVLGASLVSGDLYVRNIPTFDDMERFYLMLTARFEFALSD